MRETSDFEVSQGLSGDPVNPSWAKVSANMDRRDRARKRSLSVQEKDIEKAIQQAFQMKHRIALAKMDAGGIGSHKGVRLMPPQLVEALALPSLPLGLSYWVGIPPGFSDLLGVISPGQLVLIEVKKPGGRFREGQKAFLEAARQAGHIAFSARSVDEALGAFEAAVKGREAA